MLDRRFRCREGCDLWVPSRFYGRTKVRLNDLRSVRAEVCVAYRAAFREELDWQDLRAAIACLSAISSLDQGLGADARLAELERRLVALPRANGHAPEARALTASD
jgi:hypothetical protein